MRTPSRGIGCSIMVSGGSITAAKELSSNRDGVRGDVFQRPVHEYYRDADVDGRLWAGKQSRPTYVSPLLSIGAGGAHYRRKV